ncbi:uncharacterized protein LOC143020710 [Oratosquilla oratoria]|uniref:uncharacterized protein LOC143020710 n=1 Tax=Oratosquilla oratoria TaxID=337810 RepID=UPI003F76DDC4
MKAMLIFILLIACIYVSKGKSCLFQSFSFHDGSKLLISVTSDKYPRTLYFNTNEHNITIKKCKDHSSLSFITSLCLKMSNKEPEQVSEFFIPFEEGSLYLNITYDEILTIRSKLNERFNTFECNATELEVFNVTWNDDSINCTVLKPPPPPPPSTPIPYEAATSWETYAVAAAGAGCVLIITIFIIILVKKRNVQRNPDGVEGTVTENSIYGMGRDTGHAQETVNDIYGLGCDTSHAQETVNDIYGLGRDTSHAQETVNDIYGLGHDTGHAQETVNDIYGLGRAQKTVNIYGYARHQET